MPLTQLYMGQLSSGSVEAVCGWEDLPPLFFFFFHHNCLKIHMIQSLIFIVYSVETDNQFSHKASALTLRPLKQTVV